MHHLKDIFKKKLQKLAQTNRSLFSSPAKSVLKLGVFFFFIFKKNKNFKNICLFWKNSKIAPGRPPQGRQGSSHPSNGRQDLNVIFFEFAKRSLDGGRGPVAPPGGTGPPTGDRGSPTLYKPWPPFPSHLSPKIAPKIQKKKRGLRRRKAAKLCRIAHLWSTGNFCMNPLILYNNLI